MAGETRTFTKQSALSTKQRLLNTFEGMERLGYLNDNGRLELSRLRDEDKQWIKIRDEGQHICKVDSLTGEPCRCGK